MSGPGKTSGREAVALLCYAACGICLGLAYFAATSGSLAYVLRALAGAGVFFLAGRVIWKTRRHL